MTPAMEFLISHGPLFLFAAVLVAQIGIPLPALPWLLAAGALSAAGKIDPLLCIAFAAAGCIVADTFWFYLGRSRGPKVMGIFCRVAVRPDSCVRRNQNIFNRFGLSALLVSKFIPGLNTIIQPLAGMSGTPYTRFAGVDAVGSLLYASAMIGLGNHFSGQITNVGAALVQIGASAVVLLLGLLALYITFKYFQRKYVLNQLRMARITVAELRRRLDTEAKPAIFDLRSRAELQHDPTMIAGAVHLELDQVEKRINLLPRDRDIVVYCSCPNEVTAARMALALRKNGITRVHPLQGGIVAWRNEDFPTEIYTAAARKPQTVGKN